MPMAEGVIYVGGAPRCTNYRQTVRRGWSMAHPDGTLASGKTGQRPLGDIQQCVRALEVRWRYQSGKFRCSAHPQTPFQWSHHELGFRKDQLTAHPHGGHAEGGVVAALALQ